MDSSKFNAGGGGGGGSAMDKHPIQGEGAWGEGVVRHTMSASLMGQLALIQSYLFLIRPLAYHYSAYKLGLLAC